MKPDRFTHADFDFCHRRPGRHASRKVGCVGRVISFRLFDHDGVSHDNSLFQAGLLENAVERADCQIIAALAGNGHAARPFAVLELMMAATRRDESPTILFEHPDHFADLHAARISETSAARTSIAENGEFA